MEVESSSKKHALDTSDDAHCAKKPAAAPPQPPARMTPDETMDFISTHSGMPSKDAADATRKYLIEKIATLAIRGNSYLNIEFAQNEVSGAINTTGKCNGDDGTSIGYQTWVGAPFRAGAFSTLEFAGNWQAPKFGPKGPTATMAKFVASLNRRDSELPKAVAQAQIDMCTKIHEFQINHLVPSAARRLKTTPDAIIADMENPKNITAQYAVRDFVKFKAGEGDFTNIPISMSVTPAHSWKDHTKDSKRTAEQEEERKHACRLEARSEWAEVVDDPVFHGVADILTGEKFTRSDSKLIDLMKNCEFVCEGNGVEQTYPGFKFVKILTSDGTRILSSQAIECLLSNINACVFIPILVKPYLNSKEPANFSVKFDSLIFAGRLPLPGDSKTAGHDENVGLF